MKLVLHRTSTGNGSQALRRDREPQRCGDRDLRKEPHRSSCRVRSTAVCSNAWPPARSLNASSFRRSDNAPRKGALRQTQHENTFELTPKRALLSTFQRWQQCRRRWRTPKNKNAAASRPRRFVCRQNDALTLPPDAACGAVRPAHRCGASWPGSAGRPTARDRRSTGHPRRHGRRKRSSGRSDRLSGTCTCSR